MKKGFTLIELLVVVLIIGILAAIGLPQYFKAVEKTRVSEAYANLKTLMLAEERARLTNGAYVPFADLDVTLPGDIVNYTYETPDFIYATDAVNVMYVMRKPVVNNESTKYMIMEYFQGIDPSSSFYGSRGTKTCSWTSAQYKPVCQVLGCGASAEYPSGAGWCFL